MQWIVLVVLIIGSAINFIWFCEAVKNEHLSKVCSKDGDITPSFITFVIFTSCVVWFYFSSGVF